MQDRQAPGGRGSGRRLLRGALVVGLLVVAVLASDPAQLGRWARYLGVDDGQPPEPLTVYPYNFTGHGLDYALGPALVAYLPPGAADGRTVLKDAYTPPTRGDSLPVRWRYVEGDATAARPDSRYPFGATLALPPRPSKEAVLTLRFYPDGRVAARYTTRPEVAAEGGAVDAALPGGDWTSNR